MYVCVCMCVCMCVVCVYVCCVCVCVCVCVDTRPFLIVWDENFNLQNTFDFNSRISFGFNFKNTSENSPIMKAFLKIIIILTLEQNIYLKETI